MEISFRQRTEVERITQKLAEFLPPEEARNVALQIRDVALAIDEEIDLLLKDPLVQELYEYDGLFFTLKGSTQFHTAFDGLRLLQSLDNSIIEVFFRGRKREFSVRWLLDEVSKHSWVAQKRRLNWEESQTLGLLRKGTVEEIIKANRSARSRTGEAQLSAEEQAFFRFFEEEMRDVIPITGIDRAA